MVSDEAKLESTESPLLVDTVTVFPSGMRTIYWCLSSGGSPEWESIIKGLAWGWGKESAMSFHPLDCNSIAQSVIRVHAQRVVDGPDRETCGLDVTQGDALGTSHVGGVALVGSGIDVPVCTWNDFYRFPNRGFGFILGFREEIERTDFVPPRCTNLPLVTDSQRFAKAGPFDASSVMNRCSTSTGWRSALSAGDIDGVQKFYGHPQPLAVKTREGGALSTFARGADNGLWENWWTGSAWVWTPHGGTLGGAPAVVNVLGRPHVFVRMQDGTLGQRYYTGSWQWYSIPNSPALKGAPAAISDATGQVRVYIRGADDRLREAKWNGAAWIWSVVGDGFLATSDPTAITSSTNVTTVFVESNGLLLEHSQFNGVWVTTNHSADGTFIRSAPRAMAVGNGDTVVFVTDTHDSLLERSSHNGAWQWTLHLGAGVVGVPSIENPLSVWVRDYGDRLIQRWWNGSVWVWTVHEGIVMTASPTALPPNPLGERQIFVRNGAGGVSVRYWTGRRWAWADNPGNFMLP